MLQFLGAVYLMFVVAKHLSHSETSSDCVLGIWIYTSFLFSLFNVDARWKLNGKDSDLCLFYNSFAYKQL